MNVGTKLIQIDSSGSHICFKSKSETEYVLNIVNIHLIQDNKRCFVAFSHGGFLSVEIDAEVYRELKEFLMS